MAAILSIETSTRVGSVALHVEGQLLLYHENFVEKSHSEGLVKNIGNLLDEARLKPADLDAVAVSKGPGSYTGLRIGISAAKGLCYGHNLKLISVDTLLSMAYEVNALGISDGYYCPMIDARRMEVYCGLFDRELACANGVQAVVVDQESFSEHLAAHRIYFFGNGAKKCRETLRHPNAVFISGVYPKAKNIGHLACSKLAGNDIENLAYFEPYYLKEFIAKKPSGKNLV